MERGVSADRLDAGQGLDRVLGVPQIPDRPGDAAPLDQERPAAGHAGQDPLLRIDDVRVMELGHQEPLRRGRDQLLQRGVAGIKHEVERERSLGVRLGEGVAGGRGLPEPGGDAVFDEGAEDPLLDQGEPTARRPFIVEGEADLVGMQGVVADRDERGGDGMSDAPAQRRPPLVRGEPAEGDGAEVEEEIGDRLGFEDDGPRAGGDFDRAVPPDGPVGGRFGEGADGDRIKPGGDPLLRPRRAVGGEGAHGDLRPPEGVMRPASKRARDGGRKPTGLHDARGAHASGCAGIEDRPRRRSSLLRCGRGLRPPTPGRSVQPWACRRVGARRPLPHLSFGCTLLD